MGAGSGSSHAAGWKGIMGELWGKSAGGGGGWRRSGGAELLGVGGGQVVNAVLLVRAAEKLMLL